MASHNIIFVKLIINQKRIYILPGVHQIKELKVLDADIKVYFMTSPLFSNKERASSQFVNKKNPGGHKF